MITAREIYDYINSFAPFDSAMSFDNVGLLIGSPDTSSEKVMLALDVTSEVIDEAAKKNAYIIVTHHPVIFNPLKKLTSDSLQYKLAKNDITVISAHTNLDICAGGVNDTLAETIGLVLSEHTNEDCFVTAELPESLESQELAYRICKRLDCKGVRFTGRTGIIKRVTVACGAGGGSIFAAEKAGADAFVTGEIKHHELIFAKEKNIAVFDIGHFRSEDVIIDKLAKMLSDKFPGAVFEKAENDKEYTEYYVHDMTGK